MGETTKEVLRSGPGVAFVPGMTVQWVRGCEHIPSPAPGSALAPIFVAMKKGEMNFDKQSVGTHAWEHGCYDIIDAPSDKATDDRACDSCQKAPCRCSTPQAVETVPWRVGQVRRGRIEDMTLHGFPLVEFKVSREYGGGCGYQWEGLLMKVIDGKVSVGCTFGFRESWPTVLLSDSPDTQPSHVCKGKPCGEAHRPEHKLTSRAGTWGAWHWPTPRSPFRTFCSPQCRDTWKPEAKRACGYGIGSDKTPCLLETGWAVKRFDPMSPVTMLIRIVSDGAPRWECFGQYDTNEEAGRAWESKVKGRGITAMAWHGHTWDAVRMLQEPNWEAPEAAP